MGLVKSRSDKLCDSIIKNADELRVILNHSLNKEDSLADKQLEYVMFYLSGLEKRYTEFVNKSGGGKSYAFEVTYGINMLNRLFKELENWSSYGVEPEYYTEFLNRENG